MSNQKLNRKYHANIEEEMHAFVIIKQFIMKYISNQFKYIVNFTIGYVFVKCIKNSTKSTVKGDMLK